ncbi:MAG: hypothetical protein ACLFV7_12940 [Phycisphaerae bacterium]
MMRVSLKTIMVVTVAAVVLSAVMPAAADAVSDQKKAQNKLLAYRAARADAIRKLAERINGLAISSSTKVKDFVTESDEIETAMKSFLSGMKETSKEWDVDGTCTVAMEVKLSQLVGTLKKFHQEIYKGSKIKIKDLEEITVRNKTTVIKETGSGAPREEFIEEPLIEVPRNGSMKLSSLSEDARAFWMARCSPRGRLMAERAARVVAMRRLAERIKGTHISSRTTVKDFVTESDEINAGLNTFIRGAKEVGMRYHDDELIVEVEMQVKLRTVFAELKSLTQTHIKGSQVKVKQLEEAMLRAKDTLITETGFGCPPPKYLKSAVTVAEKTTVSMVSSGVPEWATTSLRVTGQGAIDEDATNTAQAKLMAYRAAELDARRKLAERLNGLAITSRTSVRDFVTESDRIETAMLTYQQGVRVIDDSRSLSEDGVATVDVEIDLKPLWNMIVYYRSKLDIAVK